MTSLLFLMLDSFLTPPKQVSECNFNHFLFSERQDTYECTETNTCIILIYETK